MSKASDLILIIEKAKKETDPSLKPPKEWVKKMIKELTSSQKKAGKDSSKEVVQKIMGDIWYNNLTDEKRSEIRQRFGKTYGRK